MRFIISLLIFVTAISFGFVSNVEAKEDTPDISARAEASKGSVTLGDPIEIKIIVRHKKTIKLLSAMTEPEMPGLEAKDIQEWKDREGQFLITGKKFTVTSFQLGNYVIEPIEISYRAEDKLAETIKTNKLYISVKSVAEGEEKTDIRDVKGVVKLPYLLLKYAVPAAITSFLGLLVLAYFIYRRKFGNEMNRLIEKLTPAQQAIRDLHELFDSSLIREGKVKLYYFRMSEILKLFLEKQFGVQAVEATTSEISSMLKRVDFETIPKQHLVEVLQAADFAKFAKWIPSPEEIVALNKQAESVVIELSVTPTAQEESPNAVS